MLKNLLKTEVTDKSIFPRQEKKSTDTKFSTDNLSELVNLILTDKNFISDLEYRITQNLMETLAAKYNFEPTDKYKEDIQNKKKYINQLDDYLNERKQINLSVKNELQQFLNDTQANIAKALDAFSGGIQSRISEAENHHGIDKIKQILLNDSNND